MTAIVILTRVIQFYEYLIIAYVLMSWFRPSGVFYDVYRTLGTLVEPWLGIFRKVIPPIGMLDISPIVAILALQLVSGLLIRLLG